MTTMAFQAVDSIMILVHGTEPPTDHEWDALIATPDVVRVLVWTPGVGPNARQRQRMKSAVGGRATRTGVVTPSLMARGIVTALGWLGTDVRAFAPPEMDAALRFVGADAVADEVLRVSYALRLRVAGRDPTLAADLPMEKIRARLEAIGI